MKSLKKVSLLDEVLQHPEHILPDGSKLLFSDSNFKLNMLLFFIEIALIRHNVVLFNFDNSQIHYKFITTKNQTGQKLIN